MAASLTTMQSFATEHYLTRSCTTSLTSPIIQCPRPTRPLKRKWLNEQSEVLPSNEKHTSKRPCTRSREPITSPPFYLLDPIKRSRSDSFLNSVMTTRPPRTVRTPARYREEPPRLCSVGSIASGGSFVSTSTTPALSLSETLTTSCTGSSITSRVQSPTYREDLRRNMVEIEPDFPDDDVMVIARRTVEKSRTTSPGMSPKAAKQAADVMRKLRRDADEDKLKEGMLAVGMLPGPYPLEGIAKGCNVPFDYTNIPHMPMAPPLKQPRPDQHFCFDRNQFSPEEHHKQSHALLHPSSTPTTTGHWPFFVVEFKSQAKLGNHWVGENQAATGGAHCVRSMQKLLLTARGRSSPIDSLAFSCIVDAKNVNFWVHYVERQTGVHASVEVKQYYLGNETDIYLCRNTFKNILDWAMEERLPFIHEALSQIALPEVETAHKQQRVRK